MTRFNSLDEIRDMADRALEKIDQSGVRGATLVTLEEIDAMACTIVMLRAEVERFRLNRAYAVGVNDGVDLANSQTIEAAE